MDKNNQKTDDFDASAELFAFDEEQADDVTGSSNNNLDPDDDGHASAASYDVSHDVCDVAGPNGAPIQHTAPVEIVTSQMQSLSVETREGSERNSYDFSRLSPKTNVSRMRHFTDPGTVRRTFKRKNTAAIVLNEYNVLVLDRFPILDTERR